MRNANPLPDPESDDKSLTEAIVTVVAMFLCYWYERNGSIERRDDHDRDDLPGQDYPPKRLS